MTREKWAKLNDVQRNKAVLQLAKGNDVSNDIYGHIPDYVRDLNLMHKVELSLDEEQTYGYDCYLCSIIANTSYTWCATAVQRAEAVCLVLSEESANDD